MSQASWLKLLLCGRGNALLHHPKLLAFFHRLNLLRSVYNCTHIQAKLAYMHNLLHWLYICKY